MRYSTAKQNGEVFRVVTFDDDLEDRSPSLTGYLKSVKTWFKGPTGTPSHKRDAATTAQFTKGVQKSLSGSAMTIKSVSNSILRRSTRSRTLSLEDLKRMFIKSNRCAEAQPSKKRSSRTIVKDSEQHHRSWDKDVHVLYSCYSKKHSQFTSVNNSETNTSNPLSSGDRDQNTQNYGKKESSLPKPPVQSCEYRNNYCNINSNCPYYNANTPHKGGIDRPSTVLPALTCRPHRRKSAGRMDLNTPILKNRPCPRLYLRACRAKNTSTQSTRSLRNISTYWTTKLPEAGKTDITYRRHCNTGHKLCTQTIEADLKPDQPPKNTPIKIDSNITFKDRQKVETICTQTSRTRCLDPMHPRKKIIENQTYQDNRQKDDLNNNKLSQRHNLSYMGPNRKTSRKENVGSRTANNMFTCCFALPDNLSTRCSKYKRCTTCASFSGCQDKADQETNFAVTQTSHPRLHSARLDIINSPQKDAVANQTSYSHIYECSSFKQFLTLDRHRKYRCYHVELRRCLRKRSRLGREHKKLQTCFCKLRRRNLKKLKCSKPKALCESEVQTHPQSTKYSCENHAQTQQLLRDCLVQIQPHLYDGSYEDNPVPCATKQCQCQLLLQETRGKKKVGTPTKTSVHNCSCLQNIIQIQDFIPDQKRTYLLYKNNRRGWLVKPLRERLGPDNCDSRPLTTLQTQKSGANVSLNPWLSKLKCNKSSYISSSLSERNKSRGAHKNCCQTQTNKMTASCKHGDNKNIENNDSIIWNFSKCMPYNNGCRDVADTCGARHVTESDSYECTVKTHDLNKDNFCNRLHASVCAFNRHRYRKKRLYSKSRNLKCEKSSSSNEMECSHHRGCPNDEKLSRNVGTACSCCVERASSDAKIGSNDRNNNVKTPSQHCYRASSCQTNAYANNKSKCQSRDCGTECSHHEPALSCHKTSTYRKTRLWRNLQCNTPSSTCKYNDPCEWLYHTTPKMKPRGQGFQGLRFCCKSFLLCTTAVVWVPVVIFAYCLQELCLSSCC